MLPGPPLALLARFWTASAGRRPYGIEQGSAAWQVDTGTSCAAAPAARASEAREADERRASHSQWQARAKPARTSSSAAIAAAQTAVRDLVASGRWRV